MRKMQYIELTTPVLTKEQEEQKKIFDLELTYTSLSSQIKAIKSGDFFIADKRISKNGLQYNSIMSKNFQGLYKPIAYINDELYVIISNSAKCSLQHNLIKYKIDALTKEEVIKKLEGNC